MTFLLKLGVFLQTIVISFPSTTNIKCPSRIISYIISQVWPFVPVISLYLKKIYFSPDNFVISATVYSHFVRLVGGNVGFQ